MRVVAVAVDEAGAPEALLQSDDGGRLSIRIGVAEAPAIASEVDGVRLERPCTYDLLASVIGELDGAVERVTIDGDVGLPNAAIHIRCGERNVAIPARPADAIALALRAGAPIRVSRGLAGGAGAPAGGACERGAVSFKWKS